MTEHKNLNDLENEFDGVSVLTSKLKAEAIKWVKEDSETCEDCKMLRMINNNFPFCWREKQWIDRFNLTEEDLK